MERVRKLLNESKNLKALEEERDRLDKLKDAFNEAHGACDEFIDNEEDRKASCPRPACRTNPLATAIGNIEIESITSRFDKIRKFQANEDLYQQNVSKFESEFGSLTQIRGRRQDSKTENGNDVLRA